MPTGLQLVCLALASAWASAALSAEIAVPLSTGNLSVSADACGHALFSGPGLVYTAAPGEPSLPSRVLTVLLPPGADIATVSVSVSGAAFEPVPGRWEVAPAGPPTTWDGTREIAVWPADAPIVDGRDVSVYGQDVFFPPQPLGRLETGSMRGWNLATVPVALFRYNPAARILERLVGGEVRVAFDGRTTVSMRRSAASDRIAAPRVRGIAANYDAAAPAYLAARTIAGSASGNTYVILTTNAIRSSLARLPEFIAYKEARGFEVVVATEYDWGGGTGNTAAERIRAWLATNYLSLNIEYVLLVGDPNPSTGNVPMKACAPYQGGCPTDFYYADLTGNWDLDGNGAYGQTSDFGAGGVDRNWDVLVGRIPYYGSAADTDAALAKIIAYEKETAADAAWRRRALLPMVQFSGSCLMYQLGEELKADALVPAGWSYHRIYQSAYGLSPPPETVGTSVENTTNTWNAAPFGAVIWATHGSSTSASAVMDLSRAATLNDSYPSFAYQGSCENAYPEASNNLSWTLIKNGCIAAVGATRTSWYTYPMTSYKGTGTIGGVGYEYGYRLIADGLTCGRALYGLKQEVAFGPSWCWQNYVVFNLYGDPSLGVSVTRVDDDADAMPDGWELFRFGTTAFNPDGDDDEAGPDYLTNMEEYLAGTDPSRRDTDGDGLSDGAELKTHGTNPLDPDGDGDGLPDGEEIARQTDPSVSDSDADCLSDGEEVFTYRSDPLSPNGDGDAWSDVIEAAGGSNPTTPGWTAGALWARVNFQPASSPRPKCFAPCVGASFNAALGYGWD